MSRKCSFSRQDDLTLINLMRCVHHNNVNYIPLASHTIICQLASQKLCVFQRNPIHPSEENDCVYIWNFMTQFLCSFFFRGAVKWSHSQGNHAVLAETSMIHLDVVNIKHDAHISANMVNSGKSIVCVQFLSMRSETKSPPGTTTFHWQPCFPTSPVSSSPRPGQLITSSRHRLFLHNNKIAINIYGNAVWKKQ